ncbi:YebC/PmpR family DNA-binding transcriptional regulator [Blattabacterium cuenoti]|uniref:YebC/PmpR family DNA-binding transcriptional regulator n=1 Tax=Blattabacterium cuenoti TaxID=1653831 RepID=UPI00163C07A0|nr:YebC/PmpR family DNA-binding transcriptional regulator [Blattabacterium cuenoti]
MSGHSKWANIQRRKNNQDFRKSKIFSKHIKEIFMAVKKSGINNFRIKNAIINAKSVNIPKNTIEKTIQKALQIKKENYTILNLEGKIDGISMIIKCNTNNKLRTISSIKHMFHKKGGTLCKKKELIHFFHRVGFFIIKEKNIHQSIDEFELTSIDFGAKDFLRKKNKIYIYTDFKYFGNMKNHLEKLNIFYTCQVNIIPKETKHVSKDQKKKIFNLIEQIEEHDDVENVYSNLYEEKSH